MGEGKEIINKDMDPEENNFSGDDDDENTSLSRSDIDGSCIDWEYCQQNTLLSRRLELEQPQVYAPERGPPLLDFLFVLTAFFAATFAAFYTILSETGVPSN